MVTCDTEIIKKGIISLEDKDYEGAISIFTDAEKFYAQNNSNDKISSVLSLLAMSKYLLDRNNYNEALKLLNDARYMARYSKNDTAKLVNEYAQGTVYFGEGLNDVALMHFDNAKNISMNSGDELGIMGYVLTRIKQIRNGMDFSLPIKSDPLVSLVKIGRSISAVTDINILLKVIA